MRSEEKLKQSESVEDQYEGEKSKDVARMPYDAAGQNGLDVDLFSDRVRRRILRRSEGSNNHITRNDVLAFMSSPRARGTLDDFPAYSEFMAALAAELGPVDFAVFLATGLVQFSDNFSELRNRCSDLAITLLGKAVGQLQFESETAK